MWISFIVKKDLNWNQCTNENVYTYKRRNIHSLVIHVRTLGSCRFSGILRRFRSVSEQSIINQYLFRIPPNQHISPHCNYLSHVYLTPSFSISLLLLKIKLLHMLWPACMLAWSNRLEALFKCVYICDIMGLTSYMVQGVHSLKHFVTQMVKKLFTL
jgi:hypothetical protein